VGAVGRDLAGEGGDGVSDRRAKFLEDYCVCGGAIKVTQHTDDDAALAEQLVSEWQAFHVGAGHRSATPHEANLARNDWTTRPYLRTSR
jgi:hypothetical protein